MCPAHLADKYSLVADIGGTNTRVALAEGSKLLPETVHRFRNKSFDGLEQVLAQFISDQGGVDCAGACVAVAGPVQDGRGSLTNLDWTIDEAGLAAATGAETVAILNDLQAQGYALGLIDEANLKPLFDAKAPSEDGSELVIGVGTGFNIAPVFRQNGQKLVPPAEAGHANMPVRSQDDLSLCQFIEASHGVPGVEDVLSGRGLERVYAWHCQRAGVTPQADAAGIMAHCADGTDGNATAAVGTFVQILGTVAGNLALNFLPFNGIYLAGGVARAMAPHLDQFGFAEAFCDKGRFAEFMDAFSVKIIEDDFAALTGAASHLAQIARQ